MVAGPVGNTAPRLPPCGHPKGRLVGGCPDFRGMANRREKKMEPRSVQTLPSIIVFPSLQVLCFATGLSVLVLSPKSSGDRGRCFHSPVLRGRQPVGFRNGR